MQEGDWGKIMQGGDCGERDEGRECREGTVGKGMREGDCGERDEGMGKWGKG